MGFWQRTSAVPLEMSLNFFNLEDLWWVFLLWASKCVCLPVLCFTPHSVRSSTPGFASSANTCHQMHSTHWLASVSLWFPEKFASLEIPSFQNILCLYLYACVEENGMKLQHLSLSSYASGALLWNHWNQSESLRQVFIRFLWGREEDNRDGELWCKDAIFWKYLGTCLTDKYDPIPCIIWGFLGSQPNF